jgi:hypothetical protein
MLKSFKSILFRKISISKRWKTSNNTIGTVSKSKMLTIKLFALLFYLDQWRAQKELSMHSKVGKSQGYGFRYSSAA